MPSPSRARDAPPARRARRRRIGTPGAVNGVTARAMAAPASAAARTSRSAQQRREQGEHAGRERGVEPERGGVGDRSARERADQRAEVPGDEQRAAAGVEREPAELRRRLGERERRRLVEDDLARERALPERPAQERRDGEPVRQVARVQHDPAEHDGQRRAAGGDRRDRQELRAAGEHQQRHRAGHGERDAARAREHAERQPDQSRGRGEEHRRAPDVLASRRRHAAIVAARLAAMRSSADVAVLGARIRTLDPARPWATAVAWRDGTIVAVGDDATVASGLRRAHRDDRRPRAGARPGSRRLAPAPADGRRRDGRRRPRGALDGRRGARGAGGRARALRRRGSG